MEMYMSKKYFITLVFLLGFSYFSFSESIDDEMKSFFNEKEFIITSFEPQGLYFGFHYIDDSQTFFDQMLILSTSSRSIHEVFRIEKEMITDYWSKDPHKVPMRRDSVFYGYKIEIGDDITLKLSVYTNEGKNFINNARVYFWNPENKQFEPLY